MINLNNDVLNKDRRKLFPKINTLSEKFSLNTMKFLKQQNPYKFYRTFYFKYIKNPRKNKTQSNRIKGVTFLSLLSKTQNLFYSLPIKYDSTIENNLTKSNRDLELNKFQNDSPTKNEKGIENDLKFDNNEINYIDFLKNKALNDMHKYLIGLKKIDNNFIKNKEKNIPKRNKRGKSTFNLYLENIENNLMKTKFNYRKKNIFRNNNNSSSKKSRKQQTIISEFGNRNKLMIEGYNYGKQKYETKKEKKLSIDFTKKRNNSLFSSCIIKKTKNNFLTSNANNYKVKVFWSNLRRPIIINSSNSAFFK